MKILIRPACTTFAIGAALMLSACSPRFDWREVHGSDAPWTVLMPAKPLTMSRPVDLGGIKVTMTMTAADVDGVSFALGTAELPDAEKAAAALDVMKTAMVANIQGSIRIEKLAAGIGGTEIEAHGKRILANRVHDMLLFARFTAKGKRVYQAVVVGPEKTISREAAETFLTSFKPN
ncbi:hypothetical protein BH11PSE11_BH11PSE11_09580 [soil metagenome]